MSFPDTQATALTQEQLAARRKALEQKIQTGSGWLWSVAGFSLANAVLFRIGVDFGFLVGLGATIFCEAGLRVAAKDPSQGGSAGLALVIYVVEGLMILGFALVARACDKRRRWLLVAGLLFYALDTLLVGFLQFWPGLAYHLLVLWFGFAAVRAIGEERRLPKPDPASAPAPVVTAPQPPPIIPLRPPPLAAQRPPALAAPRLPPVVAQAKEQFAQDDSLGPEIGKRREGRGLFSRVYGIQALIVMLSVLGAVILLFVYMGRLLDGDGPVR